MTQREVVGEVSVKCHASMPLLSDSGGPECTRNGAHRLHECILYSKNRSVHFSAFSKHGILIRIKYFSVGLCKEHQTESKDAFPTQPLKYPAALNNNSNSYSGC